MSPPPYIPSSVDVDVLDAIDVSTGRQGILLNGIKELQPVGWSYRTLTLAVTREFDDGEGSRLGKRDVHSGAYRRSGTPEVTDQHRSSFTTSVRRLEERNYLVRWCHPKLSYFSHLHFVELSRSV